MIYPEFEDVLYINREFLAAKVPDYVVMARTE